MKLPTSLFKTSRVALGCALFGYSLVPTPQAHAAVLDYIEIGPMYMAYFGFDAGTGVVSWTNPGDYAYDGPQVLRPLAATQPGDYFGGSDPWVGLLNPVEHGGQGAAYSRLVGFSLTSGLRNFLIGNDYSLAIRLDSITFTSGGSPAGNAGVYYYNSGRDDWGTNDPDKKEWSELGGGNLLIWNGTSFSNMVHLLVATTDPFATSYDIAYTVSIVANQPGGNANATVVDTVSFVDGITPATFSYTAQSVGAIPEPTTVGVFLAGGLALWVARRRNS